MKHNRGLSRAIRMIFCSISAAVLGRSALRALLPSCFLAINLRYQRSSVSGVTRVPISTGGGNVPGIAKLVKSAGSSVTGRALAHCLGRHCDETPDS